jgi:hypothetical protein
MPKAIVGYFLRVSFRKGQNVRSGYVSREIIQVRVICTDEFVGDCSRREAKRKIEPLACQRKIVGDLVSVWRRQLQFKLKATPYGTVEQFRVIRCTYDNDMGRKVVDLEQKGTHNALNLPGLMNVTSLLAQRVELVKKEDTPSRMGKLKEPPEPGCGFTEIAGY